MEFLQVRKYTIAGLSFLVKNRNQQDDLDKLGPLIPFLSEKKCEKFTVVNIDDRYPTNVLDDVPDVFYCNISGTNVYSRVKVLGIVYYVMLENHKGETLCVSIVSKQQNEVNVVLTDKISDNGSRYKFILHALSSVFVYVGIFQNVILTHASGVVYDEKSYLFLGKSGTGKSTHSLLWYNSFPNVKIFNDDHPALVLDKGLVWASGTPWSGSTYCYHNIIKPIGGIVMIHQATENRIESVSPLRAMAILMPSIVGDMKWDKEIHGSIIKIVESIVKKIPVYDLWCTPTKEAAILCKQVIADGREDLLEI